LALSLAVVIPIYTQKKLQSFNTIRKLGTKIQPNRIKLRKVNIHENKSVKYYT